MSTGNPSSNGGGRRKVLIPTGNEELDLKLAGGLPCPSLVVIEGGHGTAKTVLVQQFVYGLLRQGLRVVIFTTETTSRDYVVKMTRLNFDVVEDFIRGRLRVYSTQVGGIRWTRSFARQLLPRLSKWMLTRAEEFDAVAVDSLSHLAIYSSPGEVMDFFNVVRRTADRDKMVLVTLHEGVLREDLATRARAIADGLIRLKIAAVGGKTVKVMEILKLRGAPTTFDPTITFDVDPAFGVKLVPIALARA